MLQYFENATRLKLPAVEASACGAHYPLEREQ